MIALNGRMDMKILIEICSGRTEVFLLQQPLRPQLRGPVQQLHDAAGGLRAAGPHHVPPPPEGGQHPLHRQYL